MEHADQNEENVIGGIIPVRHLNSNVFQDVTYN